MNKYIIPILLFFVQIGFSQNRMVTGTLMNGSQDSTALANHQVELLKIAAGQQAPTPVTTTNTDSHGRFRFTITDLDTTSSYAVRATFSNLVYYSNSARLTPENNSAALNLYVYEPTQSVEGITSSMHHLFMDDNGKTVLVRETHVLNNGRPFTVFGALNEQGVGEASLRFTLPLGATNFQNGGTQSLIRSGDYVYDRSPFTPGTKQVSYLYELPWRKNSAITTIQLPYDSRTFDIYLSNPNLQISSPQLVDYGPFTIRGVQYRRLGTSNVKAGTRIDIQLQREGLPVEQNPVPMIIAVSVLLVLGLLFSLTQKSNPVKQTGANKRGDLEKKKKSLINKIADIDHQLSSQSNPELKEQRSRLFAELESVALELSRQQGKEQSRKKK